MLYVGVDAHKATTHVTVMDEAGAVIRRKRVASSPAGVREAIGDLQEPMKAVLEASYCWGPMYDWLAEFAEDVVLAHPAKVRAIADARIKTDTIDSRMLAHLLRADLIPEAYAPTKETRATKRVLQHLFVWKPRVPWRTHQARKQVAAVGLHRSRGTRHSCIAILAPILRSHQGSLWRTRCPRLHCSKAGRTRLDCLDAATMLRASLISMRPRLPSYPFWA